MAVSGTTEIVAASQANFEDAVQKGVERVASTVRNVTGFRVIDWKASMRDGAVHEYRVTLAVTYLLEDTVL